MRTSFQSCIWLDEPAKGGEFEPLIGASLGLFVAKPTQSASCCKSAHSFCIVPGVFV